MMCSDRLRELSEAQINIAGPRYTPGLDPNAPNLTIDSLHLAQSCLAHSSECFVKLTELAEDLEEAISDSSIPIEQLFRDRINTPYLIVDRLYAIRDGKLDTLHDLCRSLKTSIRHIERRFDRELDKLYERLSRFESKAPEYAQINRLIDKHRDLLNPIEDISAFVASSAFRAITTQQLLVLGEWGTGKTHFLADITRMRNEDNKPTLFFLANSLTNGIDPLQAVCDLTGLAVTPEDLLRGLHELRPSCTERTLLIIDGINETEVSAWRRALKSLPTRISAFPNVAIILSCRIPTAPKLLPDDRDRTWNTIYHRGFEDIEFDAQREFFDFFQIPVPSIPLLTPEFSRPLFLKVLCTTINAMKHREQGIYFRQLSAGQKGMTKVLEDFAKYIGRSIERRFKLARNTIWYILKGEEHSHPGDHTGLAPSMARNQTDYLELAEVLHVIKHHTGFTDDTAAGKLLDAMTSEGLLLYNYNWVDGVARQVIRLPYQRFSDHLIARYLIANYLNTDTENAVKHSFYSNRPLGKVIQLEPHSRQFKYPDLVSALTVEFPERVKRKLPKHRGELLLYLPKRLWNRSALQDVFLEGLYWRSTKSFDKSTGRIFSLFLNQYTEYSRSKALTVLITLGTRSGHPYSSTKLQKYLYNMSMAERDLFWGEFILSLDSHSVVHRIIQWVETIESSLELNKDDVESLTVLLSLFLVSTNRLLRDRVTRSLFLLGLRYPDVLMKETIKAFKCNDLYVPERMLAASYGIVMNTWADPKFGFKKHILSYARRLFDNLFAVGAKSATTHYLMQEYALGTIHIAQRLEPTLFTTDEEKLLQRPFDQIDSPFPNSDKIDDQVIEDSKSAIMHDFENYTIGGLVQNRRNYDYDHVEFNKVRKQISWRILDQGYRRDDFINVERRIGRHSMMRNSDSPGKIDRYGKKYSWIAYFERLGVSVNDNSLPEHAWASRVIDLDIDPSFLPRPNEVSMQIEYPFNKAPAQLLDWLTNSPMPQYKPLLLRQEVDGNDGPWVLLDGYHEEVCKTDSRRLFTFIKAFLVDKGDLKAYLKAIPSMEYPGLDLVPSYAEDNTTFASEIPWSPLFGHHFRTGEDPLAIPDIRSINDNHWESGVDSSIKIELPVVRYTFSSETKALDARNSISFLSPSICDRFKLVNHCQTWDLHTLDGKSASLYREVPVIKQDGTPFLFYCSKPLITEYLKEHNQSMVWLIWGEWGLIGRKERSIDGSAANIVDDYKNVFSTAIPYEPE
jgi:hypothetical protein